MAAVNTPGGAGGSSEVGYDVAKHLGTGGSAGYGALPHHATALDMQNAISAVFSRCCPADIRLHRTLDPSVENWDERCRARVIGLRWKNGTAQVYCEWPIGSKNLFNQGSLGYEFIKIYAHAANSYGSEITHPNAWKDLIVCMKHVEPRESPEQAVDDEPPIDQWMRLGALLPLQIRTKVLHTFLDRPCFTLANDDLCVSSGQDRIRCECVAQGSP